MEWMRYEKGRPGLAGHYQLFFIIAHWVALCQYFFAKSCPRRRRFIAISDIREGVGVFTVIKSGVVARTRPTYATVITKYAYT